MTDDNKAVDKISESQYKLLLKFLPYVSKNGFQSLRMDEIAKIMDISRVTLYKYFSTKEEIIQLVTNRFVNYIVNESTMISAPQEEIMYAVRFQQLFESSVSLSIYVTGHFLQELQIVYPAMYEQLWEALQRRDQQILTFYQEGINKNVFNDINGKLLNLQDQLLHQMLDSKYLLMNQLTIDKVLYDFYKIKKQQLFKPEKLNLVDDSVIEPKIEYIAQKISKTLY